MSQYVSPQSSIFNLVAYMSIMLCLLTLQAPDRDLRGSHAEPMSAQYGNRHDTVQSMVETGFTSDTIQSSLSDAVGAKAHQGMSNGHMHRVQNGFCSDSGSSNSAALSGRSVDTMVSCVYT
jgi:hypothetical protein